MGIRQILAPLTGADSDQRTLTLALGVARDLQAHVEALFVRPDPTETLPYLGEGLSGPVVENIIQATTAAANEAAQAARGHFDQATLAANIAPVAASPKPGQASARFSARTGRLAEVVALAGRLSDLVVFPEGAWDAAPSLVTAVEAALMTAVRPILLAPRGGPLPEVGRNALVGWDGSAEAAHAVSAALPLLVRAAKIDIVTVIGPSPPVSIEELLSYLALHGLSAETHLIDAHNAPVGMVLLEAATDMGSGLLVMGGYGHSRIREFILGGTTRRILSNARIPVFIAH